MSITSDAKPPPMQGTSIVKMKTRPRVTEAVEYGNSGSWWVEYPDGMLDLSRTAHLGDGGAPAANAKGLKDVGVDGDRTIRVDPAKSALVVIDMQNFFLHPELRDHPLGLQCVDPTLKMLPALRAAGVKILWVNWGLTEHELHTIPPSLVRSFTKVGNAGGFGSALPGDFGRLLMRGTRNAELFAPLQAEYLAGAQAGTDVWVHKNRMSALWGPQSALDVYLQEEGITTLFVTGVNADQCVLGTLVDSYYRGYDVVLVKDATATTSPEGGYSNVCYNVGNSYGFITDSQRIVEGMA